MLRASVVLALVPMVLVLSGCGGEAPVGSTVKTVPLTGKISLDGKPHGPASVRFVPESSEGGVKTAYAEVKPDGSFEATTYVTGDGIAPGKYTVDLSAGAESGSTDPAQMMAAIQGFAIEKTTVDVPADGLKDIEIKLTTSKGKKANAPGTGAMLGQ